MTSHREAPQDGLVIANFGRTAAVEAADGTIHHCVVRKKAGMVICGDRVKWIPQQGGHGTIVEVLPRTSILSRPDRREKLKPLCANVDQLVVVSSAPQSGDFNTRLLDQYLVAAELTGIDALIVVNKIDLVDDTIYSGLQKQLMSYQEMGYPIVLTSTLTEQGLPQLRDKLHDKCSVLAGESGVGKSSLIKRLIPDLDIRIGALSEASGKGRHTTTTTTLYHLEGGGEIIDSPGVREFGLWHITAPELEEGFREFRELKGLCRYRNCRHMGEAGCAIAEAAGKGRIDAERLASYRELMNSLCQRSP